MWVDRRKSRKRGEWREGEKRKEYGTSKGMRKKERRGKGRRRREEERKVNEGV